MSADLWKILANFTIGVTVALVIVVIVRPLTIRVFGARAAYGLWLIVPTMICAVMLPAPFTQDPLVIVTTTLLRSGSNPIRASVHLVDGVSRQLQLSLLVLWGAGAFAALVMTLVQQHQYWRSLGQLRRDESGVLRAERAIAPALIGIFHARLLLPVGFENLYTASERQLMLAHEEVHRRRGDPLMNTLGVLIRCLQWFNPLAHWGHGIYRQDQELACDAIAAGADIEQRATYAELLVRTQRSLDDMTIAPLGASWHPVHPLIARLAALRRRTPSLVMSRLGALFLGVIMMATAYGGWSMRAEAARSTGGAPIALHVNWSLEHAPKGSTPTRNIEKRSLVTDAVVPSGANLKLFFPSKAGAHEYELNCTPKVLDPPLLVMADGQKVSGRFWIECAFKRRDGVTLWFHPKMATWDNQEIGVEVSDDDGAGGKLRYRVMINPSITKARIEQARAAQKAKTAP